MRFQTPRGTHDVLPARAHQWRWLEATFADLAHQHGYHEIRTPMFEDTDLFVRTSGETSDIVSKEMYTFVDKGGRSITLKPEGTAPAMRAYLEHSLGGSGGVTRLWYFTPFFRYNRPAKGRYRQAHQVGLELVGSPSVLADAEIIEMTVEFYRRLGVEDARVLLNSIGRDACRADYRAAILRHMATYLQDADSEFRAQAEKNPLRLLDSKDPNVKAALIGMPPITDYLEDASRERFEALQTMLAETGVPVQIDPGVVRGLDYYTETVFEIQSEHLGAQSSLCGGGRYDDLIRDLGGPPTPSVGVGIGVERTLLVLEALERLPAAPRPAAFAVAASEDQRGPVRALAREVRAAGFECVVDAEGKSMRAQLKQADRAQARFALILGEDEAAQGVVLVRDLASGEQTAVARAEVVSALGARL